MNTGMKVIAVYALLYGMVIIMELKITFNFVHVLVMLAHAFTEAVTERAKLVQFLNHAHFCLKTRPFKACDC